MDVSKAEPEITETIKESVPYIVYEGTMARYERTIRRLVIALIISIALMFGSNMAWLHFINSCDIETYEYTQDGEGVNLVGDGNGVSYNEPEGKNPSDPEEG